MNIATRTYNLGPWMKRRQDEHVGMWEESDGPHFHEWADRDDPINQFGVVWADEKRTDPLRVVDIDGCTATVLDVVHK